MNNKIYQFIKEKNLELNINDEVIIDEIKAKALNTYEFLILNGNTDHNATRKTIKSLNYVYKNFGYDNICHLLKYYQVHKVLNFLLLMFNIFNYFGFYHFHFDKKMLIVINLLWIGCLFFIKRHYILKENQSVRKTELNYFFQNLSINILIAVMILLNKTEKDFYLRTGFTLILINIGYFIFKGLFSKRMFLLSIPAGIMSIILLRDGTNYILFLQIIIFIFLFYLIYLLVSVNFSYNINQIFGFVSIFSLLFVLLWPNKVVIALIFPLLALLIVCIIMVKWYNYQFTLISVKAIITYYVGIVIGYLTLSLCYFYFQNYMDMQTEMYLNKVIMMLLFLGLELINTFAFVSLRELQSYYKQASIKE